MINASADLLVERPAQFRALIPDFAKAASCTKIGCQVF